VNRVLTVLAVSGLMAGASLAVSSPAGAAGDLSLKGQAGRFVGDDFKPVGAGTTAQASWTNKVALSGDHSMLLEKSVETSSPSYAAAVVQGAAGMSVGDLGTVGFSVNGACTGGSPRFNLYFDTDGDGGADGILFLGCGNHVVSTGDGWTTMSVDPLTATSGYMFDGSAFAIDADDTVTSLSVLVDEQGTYYVDDVVVAGQTLGEPNS
jgi:hypothetical protein